MHIPIVIIFTVSQSNNINAGKQLGYHQHHLSFGDSSTQLQASFTHNSLRRTSSFLYPPLLSIPRTSQNAPRNLTTERLHRLDTSPRKHPPPPRFHRLLRLLSELQNVTFHLHLSPYLPPSCSVYPTRLTRLAHPIPPVQPHHRPQPIPPPPKSVITPQRKILDPLLPRLLVLPVDDGEEDAILAPASAI